MTHDLLQKPGEDEEASGSCHGDMLPITVIYGHYVAQRGRVSDPALRWSLPKRLAWEDLRVPLEEKKRRKKCDLAP